MNWTKKRPWFRIIIKWRAKRQEQWEKNQENDWKAHDNGQTDKYCDDGVITHTKHNAHCHVCC